MCVCVNWIRKLLSVISRSQQLKHSVSRYDSELIICANHFVRSVCVLSASPSVSIVDRLH